MPLFKEVKKPVIKVAAPAGGEISPLRPVYVAKTPPCIAGCPCGTDIRGWLTTLAQAEAYGRTDEQACELAWRKIVDRNPFPAVTGRVCPHPCEEGCNRGAKDGGVAVNALERFIGDFGIEKGLRLSYLTQECFPEKVAVVGAGPAGLSCAYQLARRGYPVSVFEAFSQPGGMLRYGIPKYRLPRAVLDAEIARILDLGVELRCNCAIGREMPWDTLRQDCCAVFVGIGAHRGVRLGVPGEDAANVFTGTEFLNRANGGEALPLGRKVVVVGGGDTAIDAARVSRRLGADVTILYRRTRAEMPAIAPEIEGAMEEGVQIEFLAAPVEILSVQGAVRGLRAIRMELGDPDASGRPRPVPRPGSEFEIDATSVIAAISQEPSLDGLAALMPSNRWLKADENGATWMEGIWAGGDDIGLGLVGIAISQGRCAAEAIDAWLRGRKVSKAGAPPPISRERIKTEWYKEAPRHERAHVPVAERGPETEIELGLTAEQALAEARRCFSCGMCMDCETCWMYCTNNCFAKLPKGEHYKVKLELCNGCKKCAEACPCGYIELN